MRKRLWIDWLLISLTIVGFVFVAAGYIINAWDNNTWPPLVTIVICAGVTSYILRYHGIGLFRLWSRVTQHVILLILHGTIKRFRHIQGSLKEKIRLSRKTRTRQNRDHTDDIAGVKLSLERLVYKFLHIAVALFTGAVMLVGSGTPLIEPPVKVATQIPPEWLQPPAMPYWLTPKLNQPSSGTQRVHSRPHKYTRAHKPSRRTPNQVINQPKEPQIPGVPAYRSPTRLLPKPLCILPPFVYFVIDPFGVTGCRDVSFFAPAER